MPVEFYTENNRRKVRIINRSNGDIGGKSINRKLEEIYQIVVDELERKLKGFDWIINPNNNNEWAFAPNGQLGDIPDYNAIWCYPVRRNNNHQDGPDVRIFLHPSYKEEIKEHEAYKSHDKSFFGYQTEIRDISFFNEDFEWLLIKIQNKDNAGSVVEYICDIFQPQ